MREPYAVLSQKSNSGRHTHKKKKKKSKSFPHKWAISSHRNLSSFCRFFRKCFCHMQLLLPGLGMNYLEWQPHKNQLTFVFNATVIAIMGKISPEAHIQTLSPKNISCRNFPREGKKLKILQQMMSLLRFTSEMFPKHHDTRD